MDQQTNRIIVAATEFSEAADAVTRWAVGLARWQKAKLALVHAIEPLLVAGGDIEVQTKVTDAVERRLAESMAIATSAGVPAECEYHIGKPPKVVVDAARNMKAALLVVGSRGLTRYARLLLGSTADRIVRTASTPVLVVHPADAAKKPTFKTILVPTDFSEEAALATSQAVRLLQAGDGGHLVLLHVCAPPVVYADPTVAAVWVQSDLDEAQVHAQRQLESLAASLRSDSIKVTTKAITGYPADIIEQEAQDVQADLIAMGTQGRTGLERFLMGSVAERILRHAPCPVLTVRRPDPSEPIQLAAS